MLHGFDISAYQSSDVLASVPAVDFVLVKATEGKSYVSSKFDAQYASAGKRARLRGAYHFARPEESSARDQCVRFLDTVQPVPGEIVMLDLEASKLSQSETNAWAREFGDRLRDQAPGVASWLYMSAGYASSGTGRGLAQHFDRWMYPQYPAAYQLGPASPDVEERRAANRSHLVDSRVPVALTTSKWPSAFSPWLPSGLTCGWKAPHIWQFTDNWRGLDASISTLTIDQLAGGGGHPQEDTMPYGGQLPAGKGAQINVSFPRGSLSAMGLVVDNSLAIDGVIKAEPQAEVRYAIHRYTGHWQTGTVKVGSKDGGKDHSPKTVIQFDHHDEVDWFSLVRLDDGTRPVGWDAS